jgi:hypothetical protein
MRWAAVFLVVVVACKRGGESPPVLMPSLDVPAVSSEPEPATVSPLAFEELDGPPASAPVGDPVEITLVAPTVGAKRTRKHLHRALYHIVFADGRPDRWEETQRTFVLHEEILSVADHRVTQIGITVEQADEVLLLDGKRHAQPLLAGGYTVDISGRSPRGVKMAVIGRRMDSREEEELSMLLRADSANATRFHDLVQQHPLRVGEAVRLTEDEQMTLLQGILPSAVTFSLRKLDNGVATYQLDTRLDRDGRKRAVRELYVLRVATGQILEAREAMTSHDNDKRMATEQQELTVAQYTWDEAQ